MIMETSTALMLTMLIPALAVVINLVLRNSPDLRDGLTFLAALATFGAVLKFYTTKAMAPLRPLFCSRCWVALIWPFRLSRSG